MTLQQACVLMEGNSVSILFQQDRDVEWSAVHHMLGTAYTTVAAPPCCDCGLFKQSRCCLAKDATCLLLHSY